MTIINYVYLLSLVVWIGSIIFFSFFAAPAIFKTLDRNTAGEVVDVLFPKYYAIGYICSFFAIATLAIRLQSIQNWQLGILATMAICSVSAGVGVGPKARKIKNQIKKAGGAENNPELKTKFDKLHSLSVRLNAAALILGLTILWFTAGDL